MSEATATSRATKPVLLGLAATVVVICLHVSGLEDRLELQALDFRFRHFAAAPQNDDVVHVDIDDGSLEELGRWPWPRELLAGIVTTLDECGSAALAVDIIMPEPQKTRYVSAEHELYTTDSAGLIGPGKPRAVFDDVALAEALQSAGRVFVPMHVRSGEDQTSPAVARLAEWILAKPGLSAAEARAAGAKSGLLPGDGRIDEEQFTKTYLAARSLAEMQRFGIAADRAAGYPARGGTIVPPLVTFARRAYRTGFVTVEPDADGGVRRIPLLARRGAVLWPQFALALAAERLARDHGGGYEIAADASAVTIVCQDGFKRRIPVNQAGSMLINWIRRRDENARPRHIPASAVGAVWKARADLRANTTLSRALHLELLSLAGELRPKQFEDLNFELAALAAKADELHEKRVAAEVRLQQALLFRPVAKELKALRAEVQALKQQETQLETKQMDPLRSKLLAEALACAKQAGDDKRAGRIAEMCDILSRQIPRANSRLAGRIEKDLVRLRAYVEGRICLIGSTATGAADFVPTPIGPRTPGVVVHSNIFNTIASGAFVRQPHPTIDVLAILFAGALVTLITARRSVLQAFPLALALGGAYVALNALVVFALLNVVLVFWMPIQAMAASFAVVTAYRQLTEERAKRRIRGLFAHALSPALVDRLIEDPSLARLGGERRVLSCFFSDLWGFTALSEALGEQRTVQLLNRYFDRMTEVIQTRHGGYLNKFLGDGIFVFFGAPVFQDDHAARSVQAAVDCQDEVARINRELAEESQHAPRLRSRIGIATGEVMVGNCGSTQRMDYTAIGDTVNLASRLESANKFFGTGILVSDQTWQAAGAEGILARPLGQVLVVGKTEPVQVWNVLARSGESDAAMEAACVEFARGMEQFAAGKFAESAEAFQAALKLSPDDGPAKVYLDLCRAYLASPPAGDWDGVVQLTEK